jgi:hypothetical protein
VYVDAEVLQLGPPRTDTVIPALLPRLITKYNEHEVDSSLLLERICSHNKDYNDLARLHLTQQLLPPADSDARDLQEWLRASDCAGMLWVMLSKVLCLEDDSVTIGE